MPTIPDVTFFFAPARRGVIFLHMQKSDLPGTVLSFTAVVLMLLTCAPPAVSSLAAQDNPTFKEVWTLRDRIAAPAGVYPDIRPGNICITLSPGTEDRRDGQGRIAKVGRDGKLIEALTPRRDMNSAWRWSCTARATCSVVDA
jgi:hypothetical protein